MNDGSDDWSNKIAWKQKFEVKFKETKLELNQRFSSKPRTKQHNCFKPNNLVTPWTSPTQTKNKQHKSCARTLSLSTIQSTLSKIYEQKSENDLQIPPNSY